MLIAVSGTKCSGVEILINLLSENYNFEEVDHNDNPVNILNYITKYYEKDMVIYLDSLDLFYTLEKRPFFVHISIDSSVSLRLKRLSLEHPDRNPIDLIKTLDTHDFNSKAIELREKSNFKYKILEDTNAGDLNEMIRSKLSMIINSQLDILRNKKKDNPEEINAPLRPDWDTYFMKLATLAASRSNCMKRRVGCVIVRDNRVIATGYNGTPRHLTNCFNGGCSRCNDGESRNLHTCLCLHAEENALLEAGRDRVGSNAILYCDTCPCLTCSVKIVQTGITEVVYSQSYSMDEGSFKVLRDANVVVRQFSFIQEPRIVIV
ncbi:hypothetical protein KAFR_0F00440 [Kazachstania africana CBS 2517]|uniref:Deoxycytidylate deaminase n=1 Tax=Kazachstania africana (strain ATCC 22294 / BCRC 22015 / CBS 2517 / CECT 1963 / NBRC 1671 / NRRL Y-8276) TaxID=1071382 RepID=H2AW91_KAZAF|nr:hypothetical protein KAFR_0F00440 [Kazachstania africana CBS 2517]CCF58641.1 hypothetical protein KAFR_0F00440 [Kazachstania africana CBS 2517]